MKKLIALLLITLLAVLAYVGAGPFLTIRSIRDAVQRGDTRTLSQQVDFPMLRASVHAQLDDYIARTAGDSSGVNPFQRFAMQLSGSLTGGVVDALVTPAGIGALLQGRSVVRRAMGLPPERSDPAQPQFDPLQGATYHYVSASRFDATVRNADGVPIVFVFTRDGLRWRLTDMRLPVERLVNSLMR